MTTVLVSILTGLFTLAAALGTQVLQGRQARDSAQDERLWNRRAETYVAMLEFRGSGMLEGYRGGFTAQELAVRDSLTAQAAAFASDEVRARWQASALAHARLQSYLEENWPEAVASGYERPGLEDEMENDSEFRQLRDERSSAEKELGEQIRSELSVSGQKTRRYSGWLALARSPVAATRAFVRQLTRLRSRLSV